MNRISCMFAIVPLSALVFATLPAALYGAEPPAQGGSSGVMTEQQILEALHPAASTRGLRRQPATEAGQSVNLNIPFEHNSSDLLPQASTQLKHLESALNSASLKADRFVVAGHTDAKGNAAYNKQLSLRRAEAVKHYLVGKGVDAARLETVGYGSEHLLTPDRPDDPSNRRVEIRDLGQPNS
jgi:outer membrane protein OmpA-like peptidoglycan-associated protein